MSIASEISRISGNIASAYTGLQAKGATMPQTQNSAGLRAAIDSISTSGAVRDDLVYSQMNTSAADYLANVTYDPSDYSNSSIATYASVQTSYDKDKPAGAVVNVPVTSTVTVQDGNRCITYAVPARYNKLYNITPGHTGSYILRDQNDQIIAAGLLKPSGSLRMIYLSDAENVRDLGGWSCDGGTIKYGKLFRGSRLFISGSVNDYDRAVLHDQLGIQHELELRYSSEIASEPQYSLIGRDVDWTHIDGAWYSISDSAKCKAMLTCVMDCAINDIPLYFHCAGGADRTGTLAMFIEAILGVSQSDIDKDYELTSFYSGVATDAQARRRNESEWTGLIAAFNGYPGETIGDKVIAWAVALGIPVEKINAFRSAMIDGTPSVVTNPYGNAVITKNLTNITIDNAANLTPMYSPYTATLTAATGYSLSGATVSVTMGGTDVTASCYSGGVISIEQVLGSLVITASAASQYTNQITHSTAAMGGTELYNDTGYKQGYRWNSSNAEDNGTVSGVPNKFTTGYIKLDPGDVMHLYGNIWSGTSGGLYMFVQRATDPTGAVLRTTPNHWASYSTNTSITNLFSDIDYDENNNVLRSFKLKEGANAATVYIRWSCIGTFTEGATVITVNEEM